MNKQHIKQLYQAVKRGDVVAHKTWLSTCIALSGKFYHGGNPFIVWQNYGSSAVRCNLKDFTWLLNVIFNEYDFNDFKVFTPKEYNHAYDSYLNRIKPVYNGL